MRIPAAVLELIAHRSVARRSASSPHDRGQPWPSVWLSGPSSPPPRFLGVGDGPAPARLKVISSFMVRRRWRGADRGGPCRVTARAVRGRLDMAEWREGGTPGRWRRDAASTLPMGPRGGLASGAVPGPTALPGSPRDGEPTPIFDAVASGWRHRRPDEGVGDPPGFDTAAGGGRSAVVPDPRSATGPVRRPRDPNGPSDLAPVGVVPPPPPVGARHDDVTGHRTGVPSVATRASAVAVPEPRSGTGPVPVQRPRGAGGSRDRAPAGVVPPPPPRGASPEDELTRRAERRRRPLATAAAGGRHALQQHDEEVEPEFHDDRDTPGTVAAGLTFRRTP
jgi:hypothetical protein